LCPGHSLNRLASAQISGTAYSQLPVDRPTVTSVSILVKQLYDQSNWLSMKHIEMTMLLRGGGSVSVDRNQ
jgi:hypothetical protein